MARIAVLMSGGTDSSCAALILKQAGHEVVGLTAKMWRRASRCCGDDDIYRAQRVCHKLGIRHVVLDLTAPFSDRVVGEFARSYLAGLTPNPCAVCNREIKFGLLVEAALKVGCERVASGHYAGLGASGGRPCLVEPADRRKSQVYFLSLVSKEVLPLLMFPLERLRKQEATEMVAASGLPMRQNESQDLCFAGDGAYEEIVRERSTGVGPGDVVDLEGNVVARHRGHYAYTVGQRFGVGGRRLYVISKDAARNRIVVAERDRAMAGRLRAGSVNFFLDLEVRPGNVVLVKHRYNSPPVGGRVVARQDDSIEIALDQPCFAPAPGQILACFAGDRLVCGGPMDPVLE
ncbi:MAG: tRNA 2-thiouridine(34) synthase MnmA [bacterium]